MYFTASLLAATAFVSPIVASHVESEAKSAVLPLRHYRGINSAKDVVKHGHARFEYFNGNARSSRSESCSSTGTTAGTASGSGTAVNKVVTYLAPVTIGATTYNLIVDTGSSNTWCGAQRRCEPSRTGKSTGKRVKVNYGTGSFSGTEYLDQVSYGGLTVKSQSIGSARTSSDFGGTDGILGLGPVILTNGTVSGTTTVPTFMDNLYKQGSIATELLGVYFKPENGGDTNDNNGELTLGGVDHSKYTGSITYFPKLSSSLASDYWGLNINRLFYGSQSLGTNVKSIIDTGTTLIYIPDSAYNNFLTHSGGTTDTVSGLASWSIINKPTSNFNIQIGSTFLPLTPDQYLVPQAEYSYFELPAGKYYSWITSSGNSTGGVDAIVGQKFLENYYSVFDTTNSSIGFAPRT